MSAVTEIQQKISNGRLSLTPRTFRRTAEAFGTTRLVLQARTPAARIARQVTAGGGQAGAQVPNSTTIQVGEAPEGFGKYVQWDPNDEQLALVAFLNAGDPLGVAIQGVTAGDTLHVVSAVGLASFAEEVENEGASAFIGIIAAGAQVAATAFGAPEAAPIIQAGAKFAEEKFKERQVRTKRRDPFGVDPGSQHKARQEGGVLICKPEAHGIYYSGRDTKFWIKEPGDRTDGNRPAHLGGNATFLRRGMGPTRVREDGDIYLAPWDHIFDDNFGYYKLHILVKRGDLPPPTPVD